DCGAEDVAEAGARIGRPEFGHGALLLVDFAGLDRQGELAGGPINRGHFGVELFADRKAVRPLFAAVARQFGLADEPRHAVAHRHLDAAIGNSRDRTGHDIALPYLGHAGFERVGFELLDAEADTLLLDIDVEHFDPHCVALAVIADRLFARPVPVDVG